MPIPRKLLEDRLLQFLEEDVGQGDITTKLIVPKGTLAKAVVVAKSPCVLAGIEEVSVLWEALGLKVRPLKKDGEEAKAGEVVLEVEGDASAILSSERTALNLLTRMCGIATKTRRFVNMLKEAGIEGVKIACTRKTGPGLMYFDKKAVEVGGGDTHRLHLDDMVLIKDNHLRVAGGVEQALKLVESSSFSKKIEIEVTKPEDALKAAELGADIVMLDNMSVEDARKAIELLASRGLRDKVLVEISGGICEDNLLDYASLKPDVISVGSLTKYPDPVDLSLEIVEVTRISS